MRQRIIAISLSLLTALAAGTIAFYNWESATPVQIYDADWEFLDKSKCALSPCLLPACVAAQDHINDAGLPCVIRFADCEVRVNAKIRAAAAANNTVLGSQKYQTLRFGAERCTVDGGFTFGVALDDAGWPLLASAQQVTPSCMRAPYDGGLDCKKLGAEDDGGARFIGEGNIINPASLATGAQCEPCNCTVFFGDDPKTDL